MTTEAEGDAILDVFDQCEEVAKAHFRFQMVQGKAEEASARLSYREAIRKLEFLFKEAQAKGVKRSILTRLIFENLPTKSLKDLTS